MNYFYYLVIYISVIYIKDELLCLLRAWVITAPYQTIQMNSFLYSFGFATCFIDFFIALGKTK